MSGWELSRKNVQVSASAVQERYQGGAYCINGYSRTTPSPAELFPEGG